MKTICCALILILIISCNPKKNLVNNATANDTIPPMSHARTANSDCPPNGKCTVEWIKNKSLEVKTDEFGSIYYQMNSST